MDKAFTMYGYKKSKIHSRVYKRTPKGCPSFDIIRLICTHENGENFADFFVYPDEAMMIATALMRAWSNTYCRGMEKINPENYKYHKPFAEIEGSKSKEKIKE